MNTEKTINKKKYLPPIVFLHEIAMEEGIAIGSATIKPGKPGSPFVPEVEDWESNGSQSNDFDVL